MSIQSIQCWDSNSQPSEHRFPPITTKPGLPPLCRTFCPADDDDDVDDADMQSNKFIFLFSIFHVSRKTKDERSKFKLAQTSSKRTRREREREREREVIEQILKYYTQGALQQMEVKAHICPIVKQIWLLPFVHCLFCFASS